MSTVKELKLIINWPKTRKCTDLYENPLAIQNTGFHMHLHTFSHLGAAAQCGRKRERVDFHCLNLLEGNTLKI